jgi:lysophospholipase L1-like esterase
MRKKLFLTYAVGLHLLLAIVLLKSNFIQKVEHKLGITSYQLEITDEFRRMLKYHLRMDGNVPNNSVVFIGDSITQGLAVTAVASPSINYGISCDTSFGVLKRIRRYKSIENASAVVIAIGVNDMKYRSNEKILRNFKAIANNVPAHVPVVFSAVLPIDKDVLNDRHGRSQNRIRDLNSKLKNLTEGSGRLFFVDAGPRLVDREGNLADEFHEGDGIHLNSRGNAIWIASLKVALKNVRHLYPHSGPTVSVRTIK